MKNFFKKMIIKISNLLLWGSRNWEDENLILLAKNLMNSELWRDSSDPLQLSQKEFKVYSQWGDDGIIQFLTKTLKIKNKNFIEFGVADYFESNTHFLLINDNWNGFVIDGSKKNIDTLKNSIISWRYNITSEVAFITKKNINELVSKSGFENLGLLHIDLDGNDYWILEELNISQLQPDILILEYNSNFGSERAITVPYMEDFYRLDSHFSGQYFGASLKALDILAKSKGYYFIGSNSSGNNAYFLLNKYKNVIPETNVESGYVKATFRDSRDKNNKLTYLSRTESQNIIRNLDVINVETNKLEKF